MNKILESIKTIVKDPEFQKAVIIGVVNTATLVIVSAALHAVTTGVTNAVANAMDAYNAPEIEVVEIPSTVTLA